MLFISCGCVYETMSNMTISSHYTRSKRCILLYFVFAIRKPSHLLNINLTIQYIYTIWILNTIIYIPFHSIKKVHHVFFSFSSIYVHKKHVIAASLYRLRIFFHFQFETEIHMVFLESTRHSVELISYIYVFVYFRAVAQQQ